MTTPILAACSIYLLIMGTLTSTSNWQAGMFFRFAPTILGTLGLLQAYALFRGWPA